MKKKLLVVVIVCLALVLCACGSAEPISTKLGEFHYEQVFTPQIDEEVPAQGYTYLVVYLTPAEGTVVTIDAAEDYFFGGTKASLSGDTYDMVFMAHEKVDGQYLRFGLVFEVIDYDYANVKEQPTVSLILP